MSVQEAIDCVIDSRPTFHQSHTTPQEQAIKWYWLSAL